MVKNRYTVRKATLKAIVAMQGRLRKADNDESLAFHGRTADELIVEAFKRSHKCKVVYFQGKPIGAFGVARYSYLCPHASIWLLGTDEFDRVGVAIFRRGRKFLVEMLEGFSLLENWVDARNLASIRWLKWCGCTIEPAQPAGVSQLPFHRFYLCASPS